MFSDVLKNLRKKRKLSQAELGQKLGLAKSTISMYELGTREPNLETLELIADFFNVDMNTLTDIKFTIPNIEPLPKMKKVPLLGTIACGEPILAEENIEDYINMPEKTKGTFALRCKGDSMINARIFDGDIVFIRQQPDVESGEIAAVLIDNEATLKRVFKYENRIELRPENPTCKVYNYENEDINKIRILGKAVGFYSSVI